MEKYYRVSDVNEILNKLAKEPAYYHDGEDFYNGICAVEGELMCLDTVELEEPVQAQWKTREAHNDFLWVECSNCGFRVENYRAVDMIGGDRAKNVVGYKWHSCSKCSARMIKEN